VVAAIQVYVINYENWSHGMIETCCRTITNKQDKSLMPFYTKINECPPHVKCNLYLP